MSVPVSRLLKLIVTPRAECANVIKGSGCSVCYPQARQLPVAGGPSTAVQRSRERDKETEGVAGYRLTEGRAGTAAGVMHGHHPEREPF